MIVDNQIIESILDNYLDDDEIEQHGNKRCSRGELVELLVLELNHIHETKSLLAFNDKRLGAATTVYHKEVAECDVERNKVISACTHHSTAFHQDASGGNDSEIICNICGKVLR